MTLTLAMLTFGACTPGGPAERYGFITRLGADTVSLESVTRRGNAITSDAVDRFPRVRQRHTEITLAPDGSIQRIAMDITTPSEPENQRVRHVVAEVRNDTVHLSKQDGTGTVRRTFVNGGAPTIAHVPQLYSLYELYFQAAAKRAEGVAPGPADTVHLRQVYLDREFDRFPLGNATVRFLPDKAEVWHDWLAGVGEATLDSAHHLLTYSGKRTTYLVDVTRLDTPPDVQAAGTQFAALEAKNGGMRQLSVRDTARATIGAASFMVDYSRPLMRGRELVGGIIPYDRVWRTGANAATQFSTSVPITLAGIDVPAGMYTLWTVPHPNGADLIVNKQTGQWGTSYDRNQNLAMAPLTVDSAATPVEQFTISVVPDDATHGKLVMEWGRFRWSAPIVVAARR